MGLEGVEKNGAKEGCSAGNGSEIGTSGWVNRPYLRAGMKIGVLCVFRVLICLSGQDLGFDGVQCAQHPTVLPADLPLKLLPLVRNHLEHVLEVCIYTHIHYIPIHTHILTQKTLKLKHTFNSHLNIHLHETKPHRKRKSAHTFSMNIHKVLPSVVNPCSAVQRSSKSPPHTHASPTSRL